MPMCMCKEHRSEGLRGLDWRAGRGRGAGGSCSNVQRLIQKGVGEGESVGE